MSIDLYLLRHAKSAWDSPVASDRERGLNARGRRDAPLMGAALREWLPAMAVHASPARRAQLTLGGLQAGWPALKAHAHRTDEALYTFSATDLAAYLRAQDAAQPALFLLGHNPALTDLVNWLCGKAIMANLPTAGFAHLALAIDSWRDLHRGCGELRHCALPRELAADGAAGPERQ